MNKMNIESAQYVADIISGNNSGIQATIDGITMSVPLNRQLTRLNLTHDLGVVAVGRVEWD